MKWMTLALAVALGSQPLLAEELPITLGRVPLLFADDSGVASSSRAVRTVHVAATLDKPVIDTDQPWEERIYIYGSAYANPADAGGGFRMWYNTRSPGDPASGKNGKNYVAYATSPDGLNWTKPQLGITDFAGNKANNIVYRLHSPGVLIDGFEKDPACRYKMLGTGTGGYWAATSPDGLHWTSVGDKPAISHGDTITLSQDARTGEYLAYHKRPAKEAHGRSVSLARSRDFVTWSAPVFVFGADKMDDAWVTAPGQQTEVYDMSVYPHAAGFIGLPAMFRVTGRIAKPASGQSPSDGPLDIQLATSEDGTTWKRTWPRVNIIPHGNPGSFDGGAILGVSSTVVDAGDHTWVYYTALTTTHGGPVGPKKLTIGRAEWRRHGFVSLDADVVGARVETKPLTLTGSSLIVNADAGRGTLRVGLLEADGSPIAGRAVSDCQPLTTDATQWVARWNDGPRVPVDRPVRVVVEFAGGRLFSLNAK